MSESIYLIFDTYGRRGMEHPRRATELGWKLTEMCWLSWMTTPWRIPIGLSAYLKAFADESVELSVVGGRINPIWESPRPEWLQNWMVPFYSILEDNERVLKRGAEVHIYGANMALPKKILDEYGGFDERLSRRGKSLLGGDETELFMRLANDNRLGVYDPAIRVRHHIRDVQLTHKWLLQRMRGYGLEKARLPGGKPRHFKRRLRMILKTLDAILIPPDRALSLIIPWCCRGEKAFEHACRASIDAGFLYGLLEFENETDRQHLM